MAWILDRLCAESSAAGSLPDAFEPDWRRSWALARVAERRRDDDTAAAWISAALASGSADATLAVAPSFTVDAVRILKRSRRWTDLEALLGAVLAAGAGAWAHREAAILYEHRLARLEKALGHARQCGEPGREERLLRRLARVAGTEQGVDP